MSIEKALWVGIPASEIGLVSIENISLVQDVSQSPK